MADLDQPDYDDQGGDDQDGDDQGGDDQDRAEVLDEDNLLPDSERVNGGDDGLVFEGITDVFDSTTAEGDADVDGDDEALDADEESDELLDTLGDEDDEDDLDDGDSDTDALDEDDLEDETLDVDMEDDADLADGLGELDPDEAEVMAMDDVDSLGGTRDRAADLESDGMSDTDIADLDYKDGTTGDARSGDPGRVDVEGVPGEPAPHSHDDEAPELPLDHHDHPINQDARLDEGLEETFPASDPVSAKHIT